MATADKRNKPIVAVVYYSMYGHIATLAKSVVAGIEAAGAEARVYQVPEILSEDILKKMGAPPKDSSIPVITDPSVLLEADAIIFGISTRYGTMAGEMKSFMDSTGGLWKTGGLVGKIASVFCSTGSLGGGQETSILTMLPFITHHGMIFAPIGYTNPKLFEQTVHGGSPWGAGTLAADGSRQPSDAELDVATHQGKLIAGYATSFKKGKALQ